MSRIVYSNLNKDVYEEAIRKNFTDIQSKIIASKTNDINEIDMITDNRLNHLPDLNLMEDIDNGSILLNKHITNNSHIALVTDSDMDGITATYVLYKGLIEIFDVPKSKITVIINKRTNGNGITEKLLATIMDVHERNKIDLVITADHSSSNGVSIGKMRDAKIDVLATDHHLVPEKDNAFNANAFINPQKDKSDLYKRISGCAVAYFLLINTKTMFKFDYDDNDDYAHKLLPITAASIIGDSMKLNDPINRAIVNAGLRELNTLKDHIWQAFKYVSDSVISIDEEFLSFNLIPLINSCNRMGEPEIAFKFLISEDYKEALYNFNLMVEKNDKRKKIQKELVKEAEFQLFDTDHLQALTIVLDKGFGINGIVSSVIGERKAKPVMTFVKHDGSLHGSGRSINPMFDLHKALTNIKEIDKDIFIGFGGHKEACGCNVKIDKINDFKRLFNEEAIKQLNDDTVVKKYEVISDIEHNLINETLVEEIKAISPFGMGFNKIKFSSIFEITKIMYVGREKENLVLVLKLDNGNTIECFLFNSDGNFNHDILSTNKKVRVVFTPKLNEFRGNLEFKLNIDYIEDI